MKSALEENTRLLNSTLEEVEHLTKRGCEVYKKDTIDLDFITFTQRNAGEIVYIKSTIINNLDDDFSNRKIGDVSVDDGDFAVKLFDDIPGSVEFIQFTVNANIYFLPEKEADKVLNKGISGSETFRIANDRDYAETILASNYATAYYIDGFYKVVVNPTLNHGEGFTTLIPQKVKMDK